MLIGDSGVENVDFIPITCEVFEDLEIITLVLEITPNQN